MGKPIRIAGLIKLIGKPTAGFFATIVFIKGQHHRIHLNWKPLHLHSNANQRNDLG